jgi:hypothetical protein
MRVPPTPISTGPLGRCTNSSSDGDVAQCWSERWSPMPGARTQDAGVGAGGVDGSSARVTLLRRSSRRELGGYASPSWSNRGDGRQFAHVAAELRRRGAAGCGRRWSWSTGKAVRGAGRRYLAGTRLGLGIPPAAGIRRVPQLGASCPSGTGGATLIGEVGRFRRRPRQPISVKHVADRRQLISPRASRRSTSRARNRYAPAQLGVVLLE